MKNKINEFTFKDNVGELFDDIMTRVNNIETKDARRSLCYVNTWCGIDNNELIKFYKNKGIGVQVDSELADYLKVAWKYDSWDYIICPEELGINFDILYDTRFSIYSMELRKFCNMTNNMYHNSHGWDRTIHDWYFKNKNNKPTSTNLITKNIENRVSRALEKANRVIKDDMRIVLLGKNYQYLIDYFHENNIGLYITDEIKELCSSVDRYWCKKGYEYIIDINEIGLKCDDIYYDYRKIMLDEYICKIFGDHDDISTVTYTPMYSEVVRWYNKEKRNDKKIK